MISMLLQLALLIGCAQCEFSNTFQLEHDEESGTYYMDLYVGTKLERMTMLIDTLANGTSIKYNYTDSKDYKSTSEDEVTIIDALGKYMGKYGSDTVCLEEYQDTCIDEYPFMIADWQVENKPNDLKVSGVIGFNRYGIPENSNRQLIQSFLNEDVYWNPTVQLDFNLPSDMLPEGEDVSPSTMTFNGLDSKNIKYSSDPNHGVVGHRNTLEYSKWGLKLTDALYDGLSVFKTYHSDIQREQNCQATLATASNYIDLPVGDFVQLEIHMARNHEDFKSDGKTIKAPKPCSHYQLNNYTMTIEHMDYVLPQIYWSRTLNGNCEILFKQNTEVGELSEGYILGQPFLRAFVVVLNYEKNTIGFANKQKSYGSEILGKNAPGPMIQAVKKPFSSPPIIEKQDPTSPIIEKQNKIQRPVKTLDKEFSYMSEATTVWQTWDFVLLLKHLIIHFYMKSGLYRAVQLISGKFGY